MTIEQLKANSEHLKELEFINSCENKLIPFKANPAYIGNLRDLLVIAENLNSDGAFKSIKVSMVNIIQNTIDSRTRELAEKIKDL